MRIREPRATALIFGTGKVVITGAKSEQDAYQAGRIFERTLTKIQSKLLKTNEHESLTEFKVQNIVANGDLGFSIKLEALQEEHKKFARCHYEPELFPGLVYKMENPKVSLLIFTSGKVVLAGAKSRSDLYTAYQKIYPVLFAYKKRASESNQ